jgi:hypothetical protein
VERERRTWSVLRHPNILPLYGFADDDEHFQPFGAFVSPVSPTVGKDAQGILKFCQWLQRGDLAQYLREHGALAPHEERLKLVSVFFMRRSGLIGFSVERCRGGCHLSTWP